MFRSLSIIPVMEADGSVMQAMNFILTAELFFREQIIKADLLTGEGNGKLIRDEKIGQTYLLHTYIIIHTDMQKIKRGNKNIFIDITENITICHSLNNCI